MDEKKYHIDNEPVSARDVLEKAKEYGYESEIRQTSVAARILRENGHTVGGASELIENN